MYNHKIQYVILTVRQFHHPKKITIFKDVQKNKYNIRSRQFFGIKQITLSNNFELL